MIAVIADDFTGAAEIGGIGLRYGLEVVIETKVEDGHNPDLLIIATNTRSMDPVAASQEVKTITKHLLSQNPEFIFKKLDSVLRGNIAEELFTQMEVIGRKRAIVVAGNPNLGRIIHNGTYSVNGVPLHNTSFANDPEFPRTSCKVLNLVASGPGKVASMSVNEKLPQSGIIIGDIDNQEDMSSWAEMINEDTIPGGSAGFFDEILAKRFKQVLNPDKEKCRISDKSLFVLGSLFPKSEKMLSKINGIGIVTMNMPDHIYENPRIDEGDLLNWAEDVIQNISEGYRVAITITNQSEYVSGLSEKIRIIIGKMISTVMRKVEIRDLLIEGGATTYEVLRNLKIRKLHPFCELDLGIIRMHTNEFPGLIITTKPGSYSWPEHVDFENVQNGVNMTEI